MPENVLCVFCQGWPVTVADSPPSRRLGTSFEVNFRDGLKPRCSEACRYGRGAALEFATVSASSGDSSLALLLAWMETRTVTYNSAYHLAHSYFLRAHAAHDRYTLLSAGPPACGDSSTAPIDLTESPRPPPPPPARSFGTPINPNRATAGRNGAAFPPARKGTDVATHEHEPSGGATNLLPPGLQPLLRRAARPCADGGVCRTRRRYMGFWRKVVWASGAWVG